MLYCDIQFLCEAAAAMNMWGLCLPTAAKPEMFEKAYTTRK